MLSRILNAGERRRIGRTRNGFTLIELLIAIVIIGILAAVALPRFDNIRERAHFASIGQDLRNLGAAQERFYQGNAEYSVDVGDLEFSTSPGVEVEVTEATNQGWAAVATHEALDETQGCAIYLGNAVAPALPDGSAVNGGPGVTECAR